MFGDIVDGFVGVVLFFGAVMGGAFVAAVWAFYTYAWPLIKAWIHAVTG